RTACPWVTGRDQCLRRGVLYPCAECAGVPVIGLPRLAALGASAAHALAVGVEDRLCDGCCGAALAEDFQLETVGGGQLAGDVTEGQRLSDVMAKAPGSNPADHPAVVPHRLVADAVGIGCVHHEADQAAFRAGLLFLERCIPANEITLAKIDEAAEAGFEPAVDRPELARPSAEAPSQPQ